MQFLIITLIVLVSEIEKVSFSHQVSSSDYVNIVLSPQKTH